LKSFQRFCATGAIALVLAGFLGVPFMRADAPGERRIELHNIHTGEDISIVYKKDGQFVPEALEKLNWFLRDWRANKPTKMDARTIDMVWEIHEELGSKVPIHFVSGYRSPGTNESLRKRGGGQAKHSQHILGKAMDVAFPDVPVQKLRYAGLVREAGGVGYYPTSGVPFVHIDTGPVRMWPRMPRYELALLFPKGRSKFTPADGRPISSADVSYARSHFTQMADAIAAFHQFRATPHDHTMVASLDPDVTGGAKPSQMSASQASDVDEETASLPPGEPLAVPAPAARPVVAALDVPKPVKIPARVVVKAPRPVVANLTLASLTDITPPRPALAVRPPVVTAKIETPAPDASLAIAATVVAKSKPPAERMEQMSPPDLMQSANSDAFLNESGWVAGPDYDDDHDNELSYRPFPLGDLIDAAPSIDNPILARLSKPDLEAAHRSIGNNEGIGMKFRPELKVAELMLTDGFSGRDPAADLFATAGPAAQQGGRLVKTASSN
jgi:uncharacterized protein YcbK (DUF882 family)